MLDVCDPGRSNPRSPRVSATSVLRIVCPRAGRTDSNEKGLPRPWAGAAQLNNALARMKTLALADQAVLGEAYLTRVVRRYPADDLSGLSVRR